MRIAFVLGTFPALSETFILNQITGLIDRGHTVDIYASGPREDPKNHTDVERYGLIAKTFYMKASFSERVRAFAARSIATPAEVLETVRRRLRPRPALEPPFGATPLQSAPAHQYDIVHCHFGGSALTAMRHRKAGQLAGRLVTTFYGSDLTRHLVQHGDHAYAALLERGEAFLAICDHFRSRLIQIGCPPERIWKHPLGIEPRRFPFIPRQLAAGETVRIVTIARFVEKKGIEYALRALAGIRSSVAIEYTIIGDGPLRTALESLARQVRSNVSVCFAGWLDQQEVADTLRRAHLLIAPSVTGADGDQEGTPTAILEAMASGLPVISTWHSGIPELVQDGLSGRLVPERDVAALSRAIDDSVERHETWVAMGQAGRAYVEERHDINKLNDKLVRLYEGLVGQSPLVNPSALTMLSNPAPERSSAASNLS
jgi:colanic acid/amylovoran biosynthesis glycosyltransferase